MIAVSEFKGLSIVSKKDYIYLGKVIPAGTKWTFSGKRGDMFIYEC